MSLYVWYKLIKHYDSDIKGGKQHDSIRDECICAME